ncbi:MAG: hypothetical protein M1321_01155 [Candidatus Marsarchaeota archaeon]|jgi:preprotein translocase subunit SecY|nr:hypothetical protein [Candidatus Marsarchaeota archaeon]
MRIPFLNTILDRIPGIKNPSAPLSFREKMKWTAIIMGVYFIMFSTNAFGVNSGIFNSPQYSIINIIFAARIGTLVTVGIGPIVLASIILQMLQGAGAFKMDLNDPEQKAKFQSMQKLAAMVIAVIEALIFTSTAIAPSGLINPSYFWIVVVQLAGSGVIIIYLDEIMTKYGITSGINLFIAGGVAYAIIAGTGLVLLPSAAASLHSGATAIPQMILDFAPLFFTVIVFLISIYILDMKIELPLVFSQFRGVGGRLPLPFLYVSVLPVILATSLTVSLGIWLRVAAGSTSPLVHFFAYYANSTAGTGPQLQGGLAYLMQPLGYLPYGSGASYGTYFNQIATLTSPLYPPWGGAPLLIPEWVHFIIYVLILIALCIVFGKFWVGMTGQSPKEVSEQLQDVGWQIPGFRRDPRMMEGVLNKYIPTITVLGSIFVALIAAFASITGAIGNGMGILLTAGIMYGVYQQLEQEGALRSFPAVERLLS